MGGADQGCLSNWDGILTGARALGERGRRTGRRGAKPPYLSTGDASTCKFHLLCAATSIGQVPAIAFVGCTSHKVRGISALRRGQVYPTY